MTSGGAGRMVLATGESQIGKSVVARLVPYHNDYCPLLLSTTISKEYRYLAEEPTAKAPIWTRKVKLASR